MAEEKKKPSKYSELGAEQTDQIIKNTIANLEGEHYANELAVIQAEAVGEPIEMFRDRQKNLEKRIEALQGHLSQ